MGRSTFEAPRHREPAGAGTYKALCHVGYGNCRPVEGATLPTHRLPAGVENRSLSVGAQSWQHLGSEPLRGVLGVGDLDLLDLPSSDACRTRATRLRAAEGEPAGRRIAASRARG
jgi:hypothetical protein